MVTYKILIATQAGTGGWTSHQAARRIVEELKKKGFEDVETKLCQYTQALRIIEIWKPDVAITIIGNPEDFQVPKGLAVFSGVPLVSGVRMEPVVDGIAKVLKAPHWAGIKR